MNAVYKILTVTRHLKFKLTISILLGHTSKGPFSKRMQGLAPLPLSVNVVSERPVVETTG